jgi:rubrerythrin
MGSIAKGRDAMPIKTPEDLREHIELAIRVELSTIPPYLYAMYSIEDQTSEAALLIRSIVVEEMLHAVLATNLLLAVGGTPDFAGTAYVPRYPMALPHHRPPLTLDLAACSLDVVRDLFMRIEQPETHGAPAEPDEFETLGQFYHALEIGVEDLSTRFDLFSNPQTDHQVSDEDFYQPVALDADDSGGLVMITDLASAIEAIEIIVHQGEGMSDEKWADPEHRELTHYYKLARISDGTSALGPVRNVRSNPRTVEYPEAIQDASHLFNSVYRGMYLVMNRMFTDDANQRRAVGVLYILMADVLSNLAHFLVQQPIGDGAYAAPTFELFEFTTDAPRTEVIALARKVADRFPELASVHEALRGLGFIL